MKAWISQAVLFYTQRFSLLGFHLLTELQQVLAKLPISLRRLLLKFISQGYQPGNQRAQWNKPSAEACGSCNQPDSKRRRFLTCPLFQAIRDRRPEVVRILLEEMPGWVGFLLCLSSLLPATFTASTVEWRSPHSQIASPGVLHRWCCQFPQLVEGRSAAYAIVMPWTHQPRRTNGASRSAGTWPPPRCQAACTL